jgi:hypothetical protein
MAISSRLPDPSLIYAVAFFLDGGVGFPSTVRMDGWSLLLRKFGVTSGEQITFSSGPFMSQNGSYPSYQCLIFIDTLKCTLRYLFS